ncbi:MAG: CTP synthase [bacterium]
MKSLESTISDVKIGKTKFIIITGGVCSSIGKGVLISSLGVLLQNAGFSVSVIKWDPYLNVDPGTMSPLEHGEVFVTADGAETDLDLGHYERMLGIRLTKDSSVSSGQIFQEIIEGERKGAFLGKCIQFVPHVVDAIKNRLYSFALTHPVDFVLLEIGGTVGDMEGQVFLEAVRQIGMDLGQSKVFHGHLSYVPFLEWTGEIKTKPTQHSVNRLKMDGLVPNCLFLRASQAIPIKAKEKLSTMCDVSRNLIFQVLTFDPVYRLFLDLNQQDVGIRIQEYFSIKQPKTSNLSAWQGLLEQIEQCKRSVSIGIVAKYVGNNDPYISVIEALKSAAYVNNVRAEISVIDAEQLASKSEDAWKQLQECQGVVVPGGFDTRGVEGKILTAQWARENKIPYLGLCLGVQVMLIEYARSVIGLDGANSTEFDGKTSHPVISLLHEQQNVMQKGGSMRLGEYACSIVPETRAFQAYGKDVVFERHRHRYEFNNRYKEQFEQAGIVFSGSFEKQGLIEIAEIKDHPFMIGTQFHPEFLSLPLKPHPLFKLFVEAMIVKNK